MRLIGIAIATLFAGTAVAQPVTRPERDPCRVTIVLAPDTVRAEIEAWVRAEPRCERELEVRVVPTEAGFYISARDDRGRVRERVVPDAQSAAVLIVSWMADDSLGPTFPVPVDDEPVAELEPPDPPLAAIETPPEEVGFVEPLQRSLRRAEVNRRWLTLGALGSSGERRGVRGQLDLVARRSWRLGIAGGWVGGDRGEERVGQARVTLGTQRSFGRISLRAQLGIGADVAHDEMSHDQMDGPGRAINGKAEAGVFAGFRITDAWGVMGGPLVEKSSDARPTLSVFLGLQRGL